MSNASTLTPVSKNYDQFPTFESQWDAVASRQGEIAEIIGSSVEDIAGWAEDDSARHTLKFWLAVQVMYDMNRACRDGIGCLGTFRDALRPVVRNIKRFPQILQALNLSEREFFDLLNAHEDLNEDEIRALQPFVAEYNHSQMARQLVVELMSHLREASDVAERCNGHTAEVITLLGKEDQAVLEPLRALLCPQQ